MKYLKIFVLISFLLFSASASAEFYKYTDEDGNIRFTDDINQVPAEQRANIHSYVESRSKEVPEQDARQENQEPSGQQANVSDASANTAEEGSLEALKNRIETIKQEIDQEYKALIKEKEQLAEEKKNVETQEQAISYNKKIESYNQRGQKFIDKQKERDALIDDYNARIMKKNAENKNQ